MRQCTRASGWGRGKTVEVILCLFVWRVGLCYNNTSDAFRLIEDVVKIHSVLESVYPVDGQMTLVNLTFFPINIIALQEREQRFTLSGWFSATWYDPNLQWDAHKYGNISEVYVAHDKIWKPDLTVINGAENLPGVAGSHIALGLSSYGQVEWLPGNVFSVTCKMTLTNFPFDEQDCFLVVSTWVYTSETVQLLPQDPAVMLDSWQANSEWDLAGVTCLSYNHTSGGKPYPYVQYHFQLRRRSTFYVIKFLAPIVILSLLNAFVFCVPPESGEKVSLAVSTMLSLTVFLAYLTDVTPSNSDTVPEVAIFVFLHLSLGALGVVCNILLLWRHFHRAHHHQQHAHGRRRMREEVWLTEEPQDRGNSGENSVKMTSVWTTDVDETVEEEGDLYPLQEGSGRRFFHRSLPSSWSRERTLYPPPFSSAGSCGFSDIARDRYFAYERGRDSDRKQFDTGNRNSNSQNSNTHMDSRSTGRRASSPSDRPCDSGLCRSKREGVRKLLDRHSGNICFWLFLSGSLLVSGTFFLRNC